MSITEFLGRGDVIRTEFPSEDLLPLYIGSGSSGGCIDGFGWMSENLFKGERAFHNRALHFRTFKHFSRGNHAVDMITPLYHIGFAQDVKIAKAGYRQTLSLARACVDTAYTLENGTKIRIRAFAHTEHPDVLSFIYEHDGDAPAVLLAPEKAIAGHYGERWEGEYSIVENGFDVYSNVCRTAVRLHTLSACGKIDITACEDGIRIHPTTGKGSHLLAIFAAANPEEANAAMAEMTSIDAWAVSAVAAWQRTVGESYITVSDDFAMTMTARSMYLVLSSFSAKKSPPSAPMGYTGYGWPFHFPQDVSFIHPALLRLGKIEHAKRIVETYRATLEDMEEITKRIYGGRGAMWAWIYPMKADRTYLFDGAPNSCYYEIHNAAYPARMAYETAKQSGDEEWMRTVAFPIIRASADFYASHLKKNAEGTWDLQVTPSLSQDEYARPDDVNYLCALYSARYTLTLAAKLGMHEYDDILADGLSFARLFDKERNLYRTSENMAEDTWGKEKHPVQLNPLVFLPTESLNAAEKNAYAQRAEICKASKDDIFYGWTLGAFCLAASHMGDAEGLYYELHRAEIASFHDPESIAFYETTGLSTAPYFVTTSGFWLQAVLDAFVSDYSDEVKIASAVPAEWRGAEYHNLYTKDGTPHSGTIA